MLSYSHTPLFYTDLVEHHPVLAPDY